MKYFLPLILVVLINYAATAQLPQVISMGNNNSGLYGQNGIVDPQDNLVMIGKKGVGGLDRGHVAVFNKYNVHQWSFTLDDACGASEIIRTKDNNYVASFSHGGYSILMKFGLTGNIIWYKKISNVHAIEGLLEDKVTDDIYFCGNYLSKLIVSKLSATGSSIWTKSLGLNPAASYFFGREIMETFNGQLIIIGSSSYMSNSNAAKISAIKMSKAGNVIWSHTYQAANKGLMVNGAVQSGHDGSICIVGYCGSLSNVDTHNALALLLDSAGNYVTNKEIDFAWWDNYNDVTEFDETGFVAIGMSKPTQNCGGNMFYTRFNNNLDTIKHALYGTSAGNGANFNNIMRHNSGFYSIGGGSLWGTYNGGAEYQYLYVDNNLDAPCHKYGQVFTANTLTITQTSTLTDTSFILQSINTYNKVNDTLYATNSCTGQVLSTTDLVDAANLNIYPNPTQDYFEITSSVAIKEMLVTSLDGQLVYRQNKVVDKQRVPTTKWQAGVYMVKTLLSNNQTVIQKLVLIK